jgi:alcohol-forming fatty acyl-CoA reductase
LAKVKPIAGDLLLDNLGINEADEAMLVGDLDFIINSAASVNFDDHLHDAIRINYQGTLKMLALAQKCKHLQTFVHVSTAYVNSNRRGFIEEKIYDIHN